MYLKSRPAGNSTLHVDLLKCTSEIVELRLLSILHVEPVLGYTPNAIRMENSCSYFKFPEGQ
jgi:hypothetical protein